MRLDALIDPCSPEAASVEIAGVAIDHRLVAPGTLFGAFRGQNFDAETMIPAAIAAGAVAVVARREASVSGAVHIMSDQPRRTFALAATQFFRKYPATLVAVTGTNGKTSTVELLRQIWAGMGNVSASIGTLGVTTSHDQVSTGLTTPDIITFLSNVSGLAIEGVSHCAFEASSHGLDQYRTEGPHIAAGAFTNLSRDHLDYHGDMDTYFAAKMRLFDEVIADNGVAVVWADDDEWSLRAIGHAERRPLRVFTVGAQGRDIRLISREPTPLGQTLVVEVSTPEGRTLGEQIVKLPLIGAYQAANALVAAGLAIATGSDPARVLDAMRRVQPVRGRLERSAITPTGAPVYIDYAHTPAALAAALAALRPHATGRLILAFGAGGDRDAGKRGPMGAEAVRSADVVIVTDDNPRGEDAATIRALILAAAPGAREIGDRRAAIAAAIKEAAADDIVLIAGKGHEQGQIIGRGDAMRVHPFDDAAVAREAAGAGNVASARVEAK